MLHLDVNELNAAPVWGYHSKSDVLTAALAGMKFKPNTRYTISTETKLRDGSDGASYICFEYTDGTRSGYGGFELIDARIGLDGQRIITSAAEKTISYIWIEGGTGGQYDVFWMQLEEGAVATTYEPYFDGGEATAPKLMCAVDGTCQSTYDSQIGQLVNWWWDKMTFDGSEPWALTAVGGNQNGFCVNDVLPESMYRNAYWSNQTAPQGKDSSPESGPALWCGAANPHLVAVNFGIYDDTLPDKGLSHWKAHLAEHPLEVWVARNAPEISNIGPQKLVCPTGYGQIMQVAGDVSDCPLEVKYLSHGGQSADSM